jgi:hypothetical protein
MTKHNLVVMASDGEDTPEDVPPFVDGFVKNGETKAMFAERTRRSEGFRIVSQQPGPTLEQILLWDKSLIQVSRLIGPLVGFRFGKSSLSIGQEGGEPSI